MSTKQKRKTDADGLHRISREEVEEMRQKPAVRLTKIVITIIIIGVFIYAGGVLR